MKSAVLLPGASIAQDRFSDRTVIVWASHTKYVTHFRRNAVVSKPALSLPNGRQAANNSLTP